MQRTPNLRRSQLELFHPSIQIPQWIAVRTRPVTDLPALTGFQLPTSLAASKPRTMSVRRESPRHITMLPGGGSLVRAR
jgi:hypothetical protein